MGAQQSSDSTGDSSLRSPVKTCYYDLLQVDRDATEETLKKAYRKKALELHPDRNLDNVEFATQKFAEVQAAYEVLSDPQERAWYDSHRDTILSGHENLAGEPTHFRNVRLTSTEEIWTLIGKFNASVVFDDKPTGFYGITRETFEHLALEEEAAAESKNMEWLDHPTFGSSNDNYDSVVKPFYNFWAGFSTQKTFSWKDKHRLSDAPDRRIRRLMEKENRQSRESAAREFNDAVRFLVSFVRKRDPRNLPNHQSDADRQKSLRDAAAAQAARSRAANAESMASYELPEWASKSQSEEVPSEFEDSDDDTGTNGNNFFECVICNKTFKSDKQLAAHERSKKHLKALQQMKRYMRKEGIDLQLDKPLNADGSLNHMGSTAPEEANINVASNNLDEKENQLAGSNAPDRATKPKGDDYTSRQDIEGHSGRMTSIEKDQIGAEQVTVVSSSPIEIIPDSLLRDNVGHRVTGMAKMKREKRAARQAQDSNTHRCITCGEVFASRTKMFEHIRSEEHGATY